MAFPVSHKILNRLTKVHWFLILMVGSVIVVWTLVDDLSFTRKFVPFLGRSPMGGTTAEKKANVHVDKHVKRKFLVATKGCSIPYFDVVSPGISKYFKKEKPPVCNGGKPPLVDSKDHAIFVVEDSLGSYGAKKLQDINCCFTEMFLVYGDSVGYKPNCTHFEKKADISAEYIRVQCSMLNTTSTSSVSTQKPRMDVIYTDFFSFAVQRNPKKKSTWTRKPMNVLIFGFDSISRLNFHRQMPLTVDYMTKNLGAVEFFGYNKVDDNTLVNVIPILTGVTKNELRDLCWKSTGTYFDKCSFVWANYSDAGFLTGYGEDASWMGIFQYGVKGFNVTPTDYYWQPFSYEAEKRIGSNKYMNVQLCVGSRPTYTLLLDYATKFVKKNKDNPYFMFFWETCISHDYVNSPSRADELYRDAFRSWHMSGHLENTVMILMSDHGIRWGDFRGTKQGSFEDRLPGLFISLPTFYKEQFPHIPKNMLANTRMLTSPYDLHHTLNDLVHPFRLTDDYLRTRERYFNQTGYSLLGPIPRDRNCRDAGVPVHWCACHNTLELGKSDEQVTFLVNYVLKYMNNKLLDHVNCADLGLDKVYRVYSEPKWGDADVYQLTFGVKPGDGIFEATVRKEPKVVNNVTSFKYELEGGLSRLNSYGNQSRCITDVRDDNALRLFCYCLGT